MRARGAPPSSRPAEHGRRVLWRLGITRARIGAELRRRPAKTFSTGILCLSSIARVGATACLANSGNRVRDLASTCKELLRLYPIKSLFGECAKAILSSPRKSKPAHKHCAANVDFPDPLRPRIKAPRSPWATKLAWTSGTPCIAQPDQHRHLERSPDLVERPLLNVADHSNDVSCLAVQPGEGLGCRMARNRPSRET